MPVVKHNKLIETSYKLNSREQFFLLYLISQITKSDHEFGEFNMHYSEIEHVLNFDGKRRIANKEEVFELMRRVNNCQISYEAGSRKGESVWFQYYERDEETGMFYFSLSNKLSDYLLQLKEHFTKYNIQNIIYLSANGIRMYELLKRYQFQKECVFTIEHIKFCLGIEGQYEKFYDFKRYVLEKVRDELSIYTDVKFEYETERKKGKSIVSLRFTITENMPKHTVDVIKLLGYREGKEAEEFKNPTKSEDSEPLNITTKHSNRQKGTENLTQAQYYAYCFLADNGVNKSFILNQILQHPKVSYEPLKGYEDVYIQLSWKHMLKYTRAKIKAAAYVTWWKNEKLTDDSVHAKLMEDLDSIRKRMSTKERDFRKIAQTMTFDTYQKYKEELSKKPKGEEIEINVLKGRRRDFDFKLFKRHHGDIYNKIRKERANATASLSEALGAKYEEHLELNVATYCEEWYVKNI